jgi:hypothetical protein
MAVDIGQGTTLKVGTNATTQWQITNINWSGIERAVVDASHMATSGGKPFVASEIYDPGELGVEVLFDPSVSPFGLLTNVTTSQAIEVRFANGGASTALWSAFGYVSGFEAGSQVEDMQTGTLTIKLSGSVSA